MAYVLGLEIEGKLGRTLNMGHYLHGWHTTGTLGTLAATVTASKLIGMDESATGMALAIATSLASGIRSNFGTMTKPLHAGLAARNGILAARLAESGFTASENALDGRFGFFEVFGAGAPDTSSWADLGRPWEITQPYGLALKPYPSCGATHPAIEAALLARADLGNEEITAVDVGTSQFSQDILIYDDPVRPLEGKFSMQYCVAAALITGDVRLATFSNEAIMDPAVRRLMPQIKVHVADEVRESSEFGSIVTVSTSDGSSIRHLVPLAKGKPERWLSKETLRNKFLDCSSSILQRDAAEKAFTELQAMIHWVDGADLGKAIALAPTKVRQTN